MKALQTAFLIATATLISCGSGTQNNNSSQNGNTNQPTTNQPKVELTQEILKDIWKQVNNGETNDDAEYTENSISLNESPIGITEVKVFRIDDVSFKAFYLHNKLPANPETYPDGAEYWLSEYVYKDGKLSQSKLQPELQGCFGIGGNFSHGDTLTFYDADDDTKLFVWNGTKMERINGTVSSRYVGKIGSFDVTMFVNAQGCNLGDSVGYYFYNDRPNTKMKLVLRKIESPDTVSNEVVLEEFTPKGTNSGKFECTLFTNGGGCSGTFYNMKNDAYAVVLINK